MWVARFLCYSLAVADRQRLAYNFAERHALSMLTFGSRQLKSNLFLSPLAGYTNLPFRVTILELGGLDLATTDLVNARSLLEKNPNAFKLIETNERDQPLAVQLFGSVPEEMRDASVFLQDRGVSSIDINMGCPVKKVCRVGGGSAMMNEIGRTAKLVKEMVAALKIPVSAKMRLGWDHNNITAPDLSRALEDAGVAAIFIHGRTRQQGFDGKVSLAGIRSVVEAVRSIPVIGNGDVTTSEAAKIMINETGCAGVSIGRGAFYNPWIFKDTLTYFQSGRLAEEPSFDERVRVMCRHFDLMIEVFGEPRACLMFRKVAPWYSKRFGPAKPFNRRIIHINTKNEFEALLAEFLEWRQSFLGDNGELQERYQPTAMKPDFADEAEVFRRESIPVPKGPVEVW